MQWLKANKQEADLLRGFRALIKGKLYLASKVLPALNDIIDFVAAETAALSSKSLLRYPGGKTRAIDAITQYFPTNIDEMCSPFFGGGSIEIHMAAQGIKVYGYDAYKPLVDFWQSVITNPHKLADKVAKLHPLSRDAFYALQKKKFHSKLDSAAAFYALNRSSFSGTTSSGGMSPGHPRFTQSSIDRLREFNNPNIIVENLDFQQSLKKHHDIFKYLDPPYFVPTNLYGKKGSTHAGFDHDKLKFCLDRTDNWIMSYDDCKEVRAMYKHYTIISPEWKYGMSKNKTSKELLIMSDGCNPNKKR
jgi:DNA adenine methylase